MYKEYEQMNRNATIVARGTLELAMITISEPIESLDVWCFIWLCARNTWCSLLLASVVDFDLLTTSVSVCVHKL